MKNPFEFLNERREKKTQVMIDNLLNVAQNEKMKAKYTTLQNEISVAHDTKVLAISSINQDRLTAAFAKALGEAYALNGSNALIIDANLFNPCLAEILGKKGEDFSPVSLRNKVDAIFMKKEVYPSNVYKEGVVERLVEENKDKYDHILILVPELKSHKEVSILGKLINSLLLVVRRDITKNRDIYEALRFAVSEKIPVSKTIILK